RSQESGARSQESGGRTLAQAYDAGPQGCPSRLIPARRPPHLLAGARGLGAWLPSPPSGEGAIAGPGGTGRISHTVAASGRDVASFLKAGITYFPNSSSDCSHFSRVTVSVCMIRSTLSTTASSSR